MKSLYLLLMTMLLVCGQVLAQSYFLDGKGPFDPSIPSPEAFLGYAIGTHHTRHDRIVSYMQELANLSERASFQSYGETYEHRPLVMLTVSDPEHLGNIDALQKQQLALCDPHQTVEDKFLPVFVNLGYNVHGNEPSSSEAAMLTAYILVASQHPEIDNYRKNAIFFIDPVINPDGRDRHSHWANMHKGDPGWLVTLMTLNITRLGHGAGRIITGLI